MSQHSSPDVQPMKDNNSSFSTRPSSLSDSFFAGWCEARRYTVQEVIGKGSYGVVCAAIDNFTKERVAIKKIQDVFQNCSDATRILREVKLLRLLKHSDVVEIKHIMLPPDPRTYKDIYVVFELLESDLHTVIGANDDLTHDHHKVFMFQLLRGLNFIHNSGVLHRDLKPKNILANSNCKLKICDFGLARPFLSDQHVSPVHWTDYVATRWYRAPELCGCFYGRYSPAVDIWSAGCIFAEVLLGKPLFPGRDAVSQLQLITDLLGKPPASTVERIGNAKARAFLHALPSKPARPFEQKFPNAHPAALELLKRLLAFDPADRPTAAEALADPYFANLPNATYQEPANFNLSQFEFETRKLDVAEVRQLIYEEALHYHPQVAAVYNQQKQAAAVAQQQMAVSGSISPLGSSMFHSSSSHMSMPGGDMDMRRQFKLVEHHHQQQQSAAVAAAAVAAQCPSGVIAAAAAMTKGHLVPQHMGVAATQSVSSMSAASDYSGVPTHVQQAMHGHQHVLSAAAWYQKQQQQQQALLMQQQHAAAAYMGGAATDPSIMAVMNHINSMGVAGLTPEQQAQIISYQRAMRMAQQQAQAGMPSATQ